MIFAFAFAGAAVAQTYPDRGLDPERLVDELFPQQQLDINYPELYESLLLRLSDPLDLNKATVEELRALMILNECQLQALARWRSENGDLLSVYELQAIPDLELATIMKLVPFVRVRDRATVLNSHFLQRVARDGDAYLVIRSGRTIERQQGYTGDTDAAKRYAGSPFAMENCDGR